MDTTAIIDGVARKTNAVLAAPIVGNVDTVHLFLVTGIVIVSALAWSRIIAHFPTE
jgi:hypothetical protein